MFTNKPDFGKNNDGLVPVVVQDISTQKILMLGYMNSDAWDLTLTSGRVTFYSRSRKQLWTKGDTSGNWLELKSIATDCDKDALLIKAVPKGPVCHTGQDTCFGERNESTSFITTLERIIAERREHKDGQSYVARLFAKGINKIAQKVGEEAVELLIEAKDENDNLFKDEAADLLFHYLLLLQARGFRLCDIDAVLQSRHGQKM